MAKITTKFLKELRLADTVSKKRDGSGNYIFRTGFYYRMGKSAQWLADRVSTNLTEHGIDHEIVDKGEKFVAFRGGDSVAQGSHFWAIINIKE